MTAPGGRSAPVQDPPADEPLTGEATRNAAPPDVRRAASGLWDRAINTLWRGVDRLLTDRRFQQRAQRWGPTRWIARRRANELFDLMAGFVYTQVLTSCVQLDLFDRLASAGPQRLPAIAAWAELPLPAADRLVRAAVALRLLSVRPGGWIGLGALGAPMVGQPGLNALVLHHRSLYEDLADPLQMWRRPAPGAGTGGGQLQRYWAYAATAHPGAAGAQDVAAYSELMAATQPWVASQVLSIYPFHRHRQLLDVGGGEGVFACLVAQAHPALAVAVFDLPAVAARAQARFASAGLTGRALAHAGDFHADLLPRGADLVSLVRVIHDHDDAPAQALLAAVWQALPSGGHVLLAEPMAHTPGAAAMGDAYFGVYLWAMGQGRPRSAAQLAGMLRLAGFEGVRRWPTDLPLQVQVMSARRPAGKPSADGS